MSLMMAKKESDDDGMRLFIGIVCWDLPRRTRRARRRRKEGKKLMFLDDRECARFHLSPLCSLCPRWLNFLVGWGFVFEEAFLAE